MRAPAVLLLLCSCADDGGPRLTRATPEMAGIGATVELIGTRFCGMHADCAGVPAKVEFGIASPIALAPIHSLTDTSLTIQVPVLAAAGATDIVLTVDGRSSNALAFTVFVP